jgi:hypothetical protein
VCKLEMQVVGENTKMYLITTKYKNGSIITKIVTKYNVREVYIYE